MGAKDFLQLKGRREDVQYTARITMRDTRGYDTTYPADLVGNVQAPDWVNSITRSGT